MKKILFLTVAVLFIALTGCAKDEFDFVGQVIAKFCWQSGNRRKRICAELNN
jgi:hypothetical protein